VSAPLLLSSPVEVEGLVLSYGARRALDGLDLELGAGVHGLLGPNGAGKTTLIRVLATVARPHSGSVRLLGHDLTNQATLREVRRRIGYLPQSFGYYPRFTVREFVEYFAWLKEVRASSVPAAVDRALERVDLLDRADDRMKSLSGGMIRRVGIAQALVNSPDVLLLDEPTTGLDPEQRVSFRELIRQVGVDACVLVSTHLVEDVATACRAVTVMWSGRAVFAGTPEELATASTATGDAGDTPIERGYTSVIRRARDGGTR
jgi:ABC-2 type transport system ATP-binding protein